MHNGFLRVASCAPQVRVADVDYNLSQISAHIDELLNRNVELAVFPEMSLTGYTCADLFHNRTLIDAARRALVVLKDRSRNWPMCVVVGLPVEHNGAMYNCAAVIRAGHVHLVAKTYVPNYNEFYERRWWRPLPSCMSMRVALDGDTEVTMCNESIFEWAGARVGVEICEDLWVPVPPSCRLAMAGAQVVVNLSASDDLIGKYDYLRKLISQQSARCLCAYAYAGAGWGESSTDLVFDGKAIIAENGSILVSSKRWDPADNTVVADVDIEALERDRMHMTTFADCAEREGADVISVSHVGSPECADRGDDTSLLRYIDPHPFVPSDASAKEERCDEILNIQVAGLAKRLDAIGCRTLVVGISGGLDSTLALLVAVRTFDRLGLDRKGIVGITMPGFGTTDRTHNNATSLMEELGVTAMEIPIGPAVTQHFSDIGQDTQ